MITKNAISTDTNKTNRNNERLNYEAVLTEPQKRRYQHVPEKYRLMWLRALNGKLSRPQSIKLKCIDCNGFELAVERTRDCQIKTCALWRHRPFQNKE